MFKKRLIAMIGLFVVVATTRADGGQNGSTNTAVEHTFVQFYPELMEVARRMKTVNPTYHDELPH